MSKADSKEIIWAIDGDPRGAELRTRTARQILSLIASIQRGDALALAMREGLIYQLRHALDVPGIAVFLAFGTDSEKDEERWDCLYQVAIHALEATPTTGSEIWRRNWKPDTKAALAKAHGLGLAGGFTNSEAIKQFLFKSLCVGLLASGATEILDEWARKQNQEKWVKRLQEEAERKRLKLRQYTATTK